MTTEAASTSTSRLIAASLPRIALPSGSSVGPYSFSATSRLLDAKLQAAYA